MRFQRLWIILAGAWLAANSFASEDEGRGMRYVGASILYQFEEVTVVYPAAEGEDVERNRLSAEHRAGFLESVYGVRARVRSDDALEKGDLGGHLLVLGWNNRVLDTELAPRPFHHTERGLTFLELTEPDPDADLLFLMQSPFDPESQLVFWSRIDPVRDRFQALPRVGSDWAIVTDFRVLRQGMFRTAAGWPPRRDPDNEIDDRPFLDEIRKRWSKRETDHYVLHYEAGEIDEAEIRAIAAARERALASAADALGVSATDSRISLFVYADTERKERITGVPDPVHSMTAAGELHMAMPHARSAFPHEEVHLLAARALGPCHLTTLYEGLALSADDVYEGMAIDVQTAMMVEADVVPSLDTLLDENAARSLPERARYSAAGMLMRWIWETADAKRRSAVYTLPRGSAHDLDAALGLPPGSAEASFGAWLAAKARTRSDDVRFFDYEAQARERHLAGDYAGLVDVMRRMVEIRPADPQTLFNFASALMRTGDYDEAEATFRRVLELPLAPADSRFVIFSHFQIGRLLDIQGHRDDAVAEYRLVLDLPDQHDAHRLAREAIETPVTPDHLQ
jgi:tetratricopeptide (TPR) repeat protein